MTTETPQENAPKAPESPQEHRTDVRPEPNTPETGSGSENEPGDNDPDTFPREYVEKLRKENADARVKSKRADELAQEVFHARVAALGKLADPTDLPFDADLLDDRAALEAAVDDLIARKPHLADRRPTGQVDQGARDEPKAVNLAEMLRSRA